MKHASWFAAVLIAGLATTAAAAGAPVQVAGDILTGSNGMTLYTFDRDAGGSGQSACNGPCAANWPPLMASQDAKPEADFSVITRSEGTRQWAFKGKPLYFWSKDQKPGDQTGNGFNGVWHTAKP